MSQVTFYVLAAMVIIAALFQIVRQNILKKMQDGIQKGNYDQTITACESKLSKLLFRPYVLDLFRIRAYFLKKDVEQFEKLMGEMIASKVYKNSERKEFMELYYHTFLFKENETYAKQLLEGIRETKDAKMISYNEMAYEVVFGHRTDLIDELDEMINSKKFYGIPLGVIIYSVAYQFEALKEYEQAEMNYRASLTCFHPDSVYASAVKSHLEHLETHLD